MANPFDNAPPPGDADAPWGLPGGFGAAPAAIHGHVPGGMPMPVPGGPMPEGLVPPPGPGPQPGPGAVFVNPAALGLPPGHHVGLPPGGMQPVPPFMMPGPAGPGPGPPFPGGAFAGMGPAGPVAPHDVGFPPVHGPGGGPVPAIGPAPGMGMPLPPGHPGHAHPGFPGPFDLPGHGGGAAPPHALRVDMPYGTGGGAGAAARRLLAVAAKRDPGAEATAKELNKARSLLRRLRETLNKLQLGSLQAAQPTQPAPPAAAAADPFAALDGGAGGGGTRTLLLPAESDDPVWQRVRAALLAVGARDTDVVPPGFTRLQWAAAGGHSSVVAVLPQQPQQREAEMQGQVAMFLAIASGDLPTLRAVAARLFGEAAAAAADPDACIPTGPWVLKAVKQMAQLTPLQAAAALGHAEVLAVCLAALGREVHSVPTSILRGALTDALRLALVAGQAGEPAVPVLLAAIATQLPQQVAATAVGSLVSLSIAVGGGSFNALLYAPCGVDLPSNPSPLAQAAAAGDEHALAALLAVGGDAGAPGHGGRTPVHTAALHGQADALRMLLASVAGRAAVGVEDDSGATPLALAVAGGLCSHHVAAEDALCCAKALLAAGAEPGACARGRAQGVSPLLLALIPPTAARQPAPDGQGQYPGGAAGPGIGGYGAFGGADAAAAHITAPPPDPEMFRVLVAASGRAAGAANVLTAPDALGTTPLHLAAAAGRQDAVAVLLRLGGLRAAVAADSPSGPSAVRLALAGGHPSLAQALLEAGLPLPSAHPGNGEVAALRAVGVKALEVHSFRLTFIGAPAVERNPAAHPAAPAGTDATPLGLLATPAGQQMALLTMAVAQGDCALVQAVAGAGAPLALPSGHCPSLFIATSRGDLRMLRTLLRLGAQPFAAAEQGDAETKELKILREANFVPRALQIEDVACPWGLCLMQARPTVARLLLSACPAGQRLGPRQVRLKDALAAACAAPPPPLLPLPMTPGPPSPGPGHGGNFGTFMSTPPGVPSDLDVFLQGPGPGPAHPYAVPHGLPPAHPYGMPGFGMGLGGDPLANMPAKLAGVGLGAALPACVPQETQQLMGLAAGGAVPDGPHFHMHMGPAPGIVARGPMGLGAAMQPLHVSPEGALALAIARDGGTASPAHWEALLTRCTAPSRWDFVELKDLVGVALGAYPPAPPAVWRGLLRGGVLAALVAAAERAQPPIEAARAEYYHGAAVDPFGGMGGPGGGRRGGGRYGFGGGGGAAADNSPAATAAHQALMAAMAATACLQGAQVCLLERERDGNAAAAQELLQLAATALALAPTTPPGALGVAAAQAQSPPWMTQCARSAVNTLQLLFLAAAQEAEPEHMRDGVETASRVFGLALRHVASDGDGSAAAAPPLPSRTHLPVRLVVALLEDPRLTPPQRRRVLQLLLRWGGMGGPPPLGPAHVDAVLAVALERAQLGLGHLPLKWSTALAALLATGVRPGAEQRAALRRLHAHARTAVAAVAWGHRGPLVLARRARRVAARAARK